MSLLSRLPEAPRDPIFATAAEAFAAGPQAINATVGMMLDENGKLFLLPSVEEASARIGATMGAQAFAYPPVLGLPGFRDSVCRLLQVDPSVTATAAATGGTGAIAVLLRLLRMLSPTAHVILPVPSWPVHARLLADAGFLPQEVPYLHKGKPSVDALIEAVRLLKKQAAVLLQIGCHNPTGLDWTRDQWDKVASVCREHDAIVLLDAAYQGLGGETEEDASPVQILQQAGLTMLIGWSASKNHTIYGLRTGCAIALTDTVETKDAIESRFIRILRGMHSAASVTGQEIVALVQEEISDAWKADLREVRERLTRARTELAERLPRFADALSGNGLFAMLPLTPLHVDLLRERKIFLTQDGRVNLAGIPAGRMEEFAQAVEIVSRE